MDIFVFTPHDGTDTDVISDFTQGEDLIYLMLYDTTDSVDDFGYYYLDDTGVDSYIDLTNHGGGYVVLAGFAESLTNADFIFTDSTMIA